MEELSYVHQLSVQFIGRSPFLVVSGSFLFPFLFLLSERTKGEKRITRLQALLHNGNTLVYKAYLTTARDKRLVCLCTVSSLWDACFFFPARWGINA